jgi:hypothetical protein
MNANPYMIGFGITEILLSQIPGFDQLHWLSLVAAVMSFTYASIGLGLGIGKVIENGKISGSLTGISIGTVTQTQKIWISFQALGNIAFAYSFSMILVEIQVRANIIYIYIYIFAAYSFRLLTLYIGYAG